MLCLFNRRLEGGRLTRTRGEVEFTIRFWSSPQVGGLPLCYVLVEETLRAAIKKETISILKWNNLGSVCSAHQSSYNSWMSPFLYISERLQSNSPSMLSSSFDRVMSSAKITLSTPVPLEMECQWCGRFNQWEVKEQITDNMPLPRVLAHHWLRLARAPT